VFYTVFLPLLNEIGLLWQTNTITPAHEHFLSVHIKQKILINIERLQSLEPRPTSKTYILFLPDHEIHDIGLLFVNYQLRSKGYHTIFLGESMPMDSLVDLHEFFDEITFLSYFTVQPETENIVPYIESFNDLLLTKENSRLVLLGPKLAEVTDMKPLKKVSIFTSIESLVKDL
jgi:hypothetical protein